MVLPSIYTATAKNEGRVEAAGGRAAKELRGQTAAENTSPEPEGGSAETAKRPSNAGQCEDSTSLRAQMWTAEACNKTHPRFSFLSERESCHIYVSFCVLFFLLQNRY